MLLPKEKPHNETGHYHTDNARHGDRDKGGDYQ